MSTGIWAIEVVFPNAGIHHLGTIKPLININVFWVFYLVPISTSVNLENPLVLRNEVHDDILGVHLGSSPNRFCPWGRTDDLNTICHAIG